MSDMQQSQVVRLTSQVAQLLTSQATKLLDRNHLYSLAISCSVTELWLVNCLFTCPWISRTLSNIHLMPMAQRWSN